MKQVTQNEITKKPDLDTEQPDIKSDKYERGNPIFRDEPIHLHGYTWVLILVAIFMMVVFCCLCCQKRKSDSPTYSKLGVSVMFPIAICNCPSYMIGIFLYLMR